MQDFAQFHEECERGARLNELADFFSSTAAGRAGVPIRRPSLDFRLLERNPETERFAALHAVRQGPFDQHYLSSIPYRYEEEIRLGTAILRYSSARQSPLTLYSLGTAEGTMARTISELADGQILSLSCSPTIENQESFYAWGVPKHAQFFLGPFNKLSPESLSHTPGLQDFASGFDIIFEDTTFQMYSPNRQQQIAFVRRNLKAKGLMIFLEKFRSQDVEEYRRRELQKDHGFKVRYFSEAEINRKKINVLETMNLNEVTLDEMRSVLREVFSYAYIIWNSGNFYSIAASNSLRNLDLFVSCFGPAAIPSEYSYGEVPAPFLPVR
ncbi:MULTISPECIES: class I SAM-dependent methyltransferase [Rhizobium/Agrobacterium group]|uniref:class I SAM-dependent methyltransferase n=1 Tax=Rhizobium/Agrobacterium group TaxID=227290 RepID=UPI001AD96642|nr:MULTISPECIES: class I SAM-dependent methyltransferase [Rhizobium/Agrobacterium group]MBO9111879.1 class I SAM-dependent methyltransferase [Agrobacterium sp. S2/73]QXZ76243.1 class I SAM-dependent methyltransferase [Agrobacterium sp. S7/73]QYA17209.1 class I SAM-dependent methyltransferase [Rhizobium sp. AB2/73]UEQ85217.1 class I SAM-dependent methyltransferase [Rhizobium sp. AB2/73]